MSAVCQGEAVTAVWIMLTDLKTLATGTSSSKYLDVHIIVQPDTLLIGFYVVAQVGLTWQNDDQMIVLDASVVLSDFRVECCQ